jgi:hypothetical protein
LKEKEDQLNKLQRENEEKEIEILLMTGKLKDDKMLKKMKQMQHELMELRKEKENKETEMLQMVHGIAEEREQMKNNPKSKKKEIVKVKWGKRDGATIRAEAIMDDVTSLEDATVDYTLPKNYSVKRFVSHKLKMKGDKGPLIIELQATWKGYPGSAPTTEKWGNMKKYHLRQLKRYVNNNPELKKVVQVYQQFNTLKKKDSSSRK